MKIQIINTGNELIRGQRLNTHQQWLCRELTERGYAVSRQWTVPDSGDSIQDAVKQALTTADVIITTGGLGPTSDDLTRPLIASLLGLELEMNQECLNGIQDFFKKRNKPVPEITLEQAKVPKGGTALPNHHGTAPGLWIPLAQNPFHPERKPAWVIMLPGPPRELYPMVLEQVLPKMLLEMPPAVEGRSRLLRTAGLGESTLEEILTELLAGEIEDGLDLNYCFHPGEVELRLVATGADAETRVEKATQRVRQALSRHVYGEGETSLAREVVQWLSQHGQTLATAESCTGGRLSNAITDIPGSSKCYLGGWITYSNEAKARDLGVDPQLIERLGAVSAEVAQAMAEGARRKSGADWGLATTGIAGPDGGTAEKPVGTVFTAVAGPHGTRVYPFLHPVDRLAFKEWTTQSILHAFWQELAHPEEAPIAS